ncbi:hypothetical protein GUITHDRAFT_154250 [Guillardia theta CCMP2712]|uniref:Uncharacterized protein n=1 Tax=Guillardia theta (strain CCMP2712) TaxID=905079 RepID=L1IW49_GUITC|nr:hypothetical protein GUITHDRAFT_154250 [Guillardia theta CCMP2712]EKX40119.1 hypothetical protein GUITHDRAFT_154250 [Guillardia theta CCMP2712]|eukprot:XP_005827099.1 hypothetical protein GUITHDRAFT_154250 [Guillardia theta CCMP2712]
MQFTFDDDADFHRVGCMVRSAVGEKEYGDEEKLLLQRIEEEKGREHDEASERRKKVDEERIQQLQLQLNTLKSVDEWSAFAQQGDDLYGAIPRQGGSESKEHEGETLETITSRVHQRQQEEEQRRRKDEDEIIARLQREIEAKLCSET